MVGELGRGESRPPRGQDPLGALSVLVVDDDVETLFAIRTGLATRVGSVHAAQSPLAALWYLERAPIDVVVCDLDLRGSDGRHLLEIVRERWPAVARILITGYGSRISEEITFPAAQCVVLKPVEIDRLVALLAPLPAEK